MKKQRHWIRGIIGGILLGLSFAIGSVVYAFNALGPMTPWILFLVGLAIGVLMVFVPSRKAMKARSAGPGASA